MDDKITIIEGPPPTFEAVADDWATSLSDSSAIYNMALTQLRTFNGPALLERCHKAWRNGHSMDLEYRDELGMEAHAPIMAARTLETNEGQMIMLWVRLPADESEFVVEEGDFDDDEFGDEYDENDDQDDSVNY